VLDIERRDELLAYLRERCRIGAGEEPALRTLSGGVSNRTVLLERETGRAVGNQAGPGEAARACPLVLLAGKLGIRSRAALAQRLNSAQVQVAQASSSALRAESKSQP